MNSFFPAYVIYASKTAYAHRKLKGHAFHLHTRHFYICMNPVKVAEIKPIDLRAGY